MALVVSVLSVWGQGCCADTVTFAGRIENAEYQVWIEMDFYHNDVVTPGQEIFGQVPGYFGAMRRSRASRPASSSPTTMAARTWRPD